MEETREKEIEVKMHREPNIYTEESSSSKVLCVVYKAVCAWTLYTRLGAVPQESALLDV